MPIGWYSAYGQGVYDGAKIVVLVEATTTYNAAKARTNADRLNEALLSGAGTVVVPPYLGDAYIAAPLEIPSNTTLIIRGGTRLKRPPGNAFHLVRNRGCQNGVYVNGGVVSGGSFTMNEHGHNRKVGDQVYLEGFLTNTSLNGLKTITSAVPGVSWTFAASGVNPTNTINQLVFVSRYNPLSGSFFVRSGNVVTVTEPSHGRRVGDKVYIAGLSGANTFNGAQEITAVSADNTTWSYANTGANETATGTAQLLGDRNIYVELEMDGNSPNVAGNTWGNHLSNWGNVSCFGGHIVESRNHIAGRAANHFNVSDVTWFSVNGKERCGVVAQFDSFCDRVYIRSAVGKGLQDDVVAWGVTNGGFYGDTTPPCGPGNMGRLTVDLIQGDSPTGLFKMYAASGYDLGTVCISRVSGLGPVTLGDPSAGVTGGSWTDVWLGDVDVYPTVATSIQIYVAPAWSSRGPLRVGRLKDNCFDITVNNGGEALFDNGPGGIISIDHLIAQKARTQSAALKVQPSSTGCRVKIGRCESTCGSSGAVFLARGGSAAALQVNNWSHSGANNSAGFLIFSDAGGNWDDVRINGAVITGCSNPFRWNTNGLTRHLYLTNVSFDDVASGIGGDGTGTFNIYANNVDYRNVGFANNFLQFGVAGQVVNFRGSALNIGSNWCLFTSTVQIRINSPEFRINLGASGAAPPSQLTPQTGDMVYNTNATGPGVYMRTGAGAWAIIA